MEELTLVDYFAILRRWKKIFCATVILLLVLSGAFALSWSRYQSTATIQIEQPKISSHATTSDVSASSDDMELANKRINAIEQKVLSISSLIEVIRKFDLYASERKNTPIAKVAEKMRSRISLGLINSSLANSSAAFMLSYRYNDPIITQQVTNELVTRFLDEDLKEQSSASEETSSFLAVQIAALEASLSEQEKKIADFQKEHGATGKESLSFKQQIITNLSLYKQTLSSQIAINQGTLNSLRAQLAYVDPYARETGNDKAPLTPQAQLKSLESQYGTLTAKYGPEHPDVVKAQRQIAMLRAKLGSTPQNGGSETTTQAISRGARVIPDANNPAYLQIVAQLHAAEDQSRSLMEQTRELQAQERYYQKALADNPEIEKEMAALSRDYDNAQMRYRELKEKKMVADMREQMQKDRTGQRLSLINPPDIPLDTQPSRFVMFIFGLLFSTAGGFASVIAAQILSQRMVGLHYLETVVGITPIVAIPHIYTREECKRSWTYRAECAMRPPFDFVINLLKPCYKRLIER